MRLTEPQHSEITIPSGCTATFLELMQLGFRFSAIRQDIQLCCPNHRHAKSICVAWQVTGHLLQVWASDTPEPWPEQIFWLAMDFSEGEQ